MPETQIEMVRAPDELLFRPVDHADPRDQELVKTLLQGHLGPDADVNARYEWIYLKNPHGKARTYLATHGPSGEAAGLTSLFPRRVLVAGRHRNGAIGGDGYVRPAFRRQGIATKLHHTALLDMARSGLDFMYGPPQEHNLQALLRSGSVVSGWVQRYSRALNPEALIKRPLPGPARAALAWLLRPSASRLRLLPLTERLDPRVTEVFDFAARASGQDDILPVRDAEYYAWRFARSPTRRQRPFLVMDRDQPIGLCALERGQGRAAIVDLVCEPRRRRAVLRGVIATLGDATAVEIQIHVPSPRLHRTLCALGFIPRERTAFQVQARADHPDRELLERPESWCFMYGDYDVDHVL